MPVFKIKAKSTQYLEAEIEAKDQEEAWNKAHDMDGGDFDEKGDGSWEVESVELADSQYTDQQELEDRERDFDQKESKKEG